MSLVRLNVLRSLNKTMTSRPTKLIALFLMMIFSLSQPLLAETKVESNIENDTALQKQQENTPLTISETDDKGFSGLSKSIFPANTINNSQSTTITNSSKALDVSLGLIFILILIMALAWFMKKMGYSNLTGQGQLKIIASLNLGQKEKIALIQVGKQQLLIGMTAQQINTLHVLDEMLEESEFPNNKASSIGNNAFARAFAQIKAANLKQ